jgi:cytochrome b6-f complex iron-sulfur subunit
LLLFPGNAVRGEDGLAMMESPDYPRRRALLNMLKGAIGITLVAIFYPVLRFLRPRQATVSGALEIVAPIKLHQLAASGGTPFDFAGKPCLVVLSPEGAQRLASGKPLVPGDVRAFNALCTHVDCTVRYRSAEGDIFCNCHEGVFDLNGHNVAGPPPRPLESYKVTLRGESGQEEIVVSRQT